MKLSSTKQTGVMQEIRGQKLGLRSGSINQGWWLPLALVLLLAGSALLILVPNIFFLKNIEVEGANPEIAGKVSTVVESYTNEKNGILPQKNLIVLNADNLKKTILADGSVVAVKKIEKKFLQRKLRILVEPKIHLFTLQTNRQLYSLYSDGTLLEAQGPSTPEWLGQPEGDIIKLVAPYTGNLNQTDIILKKNELNTLAVLRNDFQSQLGMRIAFVEFPTLTEQQLPLQNPILWVWLKKNNYNGSTPNIRLIINADQDFSKTLNQLKVLFTAMQPQRYADLVYIDLRLPDKAYLCLVNTPCSVPPAPPTPATLNLAAPTNDDAIAVPLQAQ